MDEPRDGEQPEDLNVPEDEREDVKGGIGATWYLKNSNSPGAANEGAEPHLRPGDIAAGPGGGPHL
jgi:hypothetical protein